jgi:hypothetical protein
MCVSSPNTCLKAAVKACCGEEWWGCGAHGSAVAGVLVARGGPCIDCPSTHLLVQEVGALAHAVRQRAVHVCTRARRGKGAARRCVCACLCACRGRVAPDLQMPSTSPSPKLMSVVMAAAGATAKCLQQWQQGLSQRRAAVSSRAAASNTASCQSAACLHLPLIHCRTLSSAAQSPGVPGAASRHSGGLCRTWGGA